MYGDGENPQQKRRANRTISASIAKAGTAMIQSRYVILLETFVKNFLLRKEKMVKVRIATVTMALKQNSWRTTGRSCVRLFVLLWKRIMAIMAIVVDTDPITFKMAFLWVYEVDEGQTVPTTTSSPIVRKMVMTGY